MNYRDVVEILKVSQDRPARDERYEMFKRAVSFYGVENSGAGVILIGGTNGKGTVAATIAHLLGPNVGLFTSPHLIEPTERIAIDGVPITEDEMVRAYVAISDVVVKFDLTHFEILTLMMIEVFFAGRIRPRVSRAVIEVGVGGRLDPTRVIPHETAVLARIGMDHEAILGSSLDAIAREKLAIAEGAARLIYMKPESSLDAVFAEVRTKYPSCSFIEARTFKSHVTKPKTTDRTVAGAGAGAGAGTDPSWIIETPDGSAPLALMGDRAVQNTSLALEVLNQLGVKSDLSKLASVVWPARMERVSFGGRSLYLSGDHNEQGVESLREIIAHFDYENVWLVVGIGKGKPAEAMLARYRRIPRAKFVLTKTYFRQVSEEEFSALEGDAKVDDAFDAVKFALANARANDLIVVSGSLYLVGDLKAKMLE